jgi:hypothetical protein
MSPDEPTGAEKRASLEEILNAELGDPAPVEHYRRPVRDHERAALQAELDAVEPAHTAAAARLHTLYAD